MVSASASLNVVVEVVEEEGAMKKKSTRVSVRHRVDPPQGWRRGEDDPAPLNLVVADVSARYWRRKKRPRFHWRRLPARRPPPPLPPPPAARLPLRRPHSTKTKRPPPPLGGGSTRPSRRPARSPARASADSSRVSRGSTARWCVSVRVGVR